MILAIAALVLAPAVPQNVVLIADASPKVATVSSAGVDSELSPSLSASSTPALDLSIPEFDTSAFTYEPGRTTLALVAPVSSGPAAPDEPADPAVAPFIDAQATTPTHQGPTERQRKEWKVLTMASSGAAMFDAVTTREAVSAGAHELNPMLRPFASNNSIYAAIQVGPALLDYVGHRMLNSQHSWMRSTWWVPQTAGTAVSFFSGINNVAVRDSLIH